MYPYLFDSAKTQHPATHLDIHNFYELLILKMFLLFLAPKTLSHTIQKWQEKTLNRNLIIRG